MLSTRALTGATAVPLLHHLTQATLKKSKLQMCRSTSLGYETLEGSDRAKGKMAVNP